MAIHPIRYLFYYTFQKKATPYFAKIVDIFMVIFNKNRSKRVHFKNILRHTENSLVIFYEIW